MKSGLCCLAITLLCSCAHHNAPDPYEADYLVDILKEQDKITEVKLITLKGASQTIFTSGIVEPHSLVVGPYICEIDKIYDKPIDWHQEEFNKLIASYEPKEYEDCFCLPRYVMAFIFYNKHDAEIGAALFDESHDSVVISDGANRTHRIRRFRFSLGHTEKSRVVGFIKTIFHDVNKPYVFLKDL